MLVCTANGITRQYLFGWFDHISFGDVAVGWNMLKILHVIYGFERGGIETWLLQLASHLDKSRFQLILAYHTDGSEGIASDLRAAGYKLHRFCSPRSPFAYMRALSTFLMTEGPFAAVHSHVNFAGLLMLAARRSGVPVRIAHSHVSMGMMTSGIIAGSYTKITNRLLLSNRTQGLAVSDSASVTLFGKRWEYLPDICIMPCGIDLEAFQSHKPAGRKAELGIPGEWKVLSVIGRLSTEKNHVLALEALSSLAREEESLCLLLVGVGPELPALKERAAQLGLSDHVVFAGERRDVPALLSEVVDVLLLPSITEGSPLTFIEAQAAGVPCVVSEAVPDAALKGSRATYQLGVTQGAEAWAQQIASALQNRREHEKWRDFSGGPYDIRQNAAMVARLYAGQASDGGNL